jgi:hypothetical protein
MKRLGIIALLSVVLMGNVGCGGPMYITGSMGDWYAQKYNESPWIYGNVLSFALYGMAYGFGLMGDGMIVNTYYFWAKDAAPLGDNKGSTFDHAPNPGKKMN